MRETFQKWLFAFVALAFVVIFFLSYFFQTMQSRRNAQYLIHLRLQDAREQLQINNENLTRVRQMVESEARMKARSLAEMIRLDPDLVHQEEELVRIAHDLEVDELHISDGKGILVASYPQMEAYKQYDMASSEQSRVFMPAIKDPNFELVQDIQKQGAGDKLIQYTGVARRDTPGIVQVAYTPERLVEAIKLTDIANLTIGMRIGNNGRIIICHNDKVISAEDTKLIGKNIDQCGISYKKILSNVDPFPAEVQGEEYLCCHDHVDDLTLIGILPQNEMYANRDDLALELTVAHLVLFGVVFILVSALVQRIVINGIYQVNRSLKVITDGNLNEKVEVSTNREFRELSAGINQTVEALKKLADEAAKRFDRELELAHKIQLSALPKVFPPFPDRNEFDIFASSNPAKVVGGDFYDLFLVDDDHLAFVIADVSGKGIPAALFMMTTKTLINNYAKTGMEPNETFDRTNASLCATNDAVMFVTAFIGVLEISTGKLTYVNGGHNSPLMRHGAEGYQWLNEKGGCVLGIASEMRYEETVQQLLPGDAIFLYTDGVTEAFNESEELFGETRLFDLLNSPKVLTMSPTELLIHVESEVKFYRKKAEQSDDITMLAVVWHGPGNVTKGGNS
ncbi:MAG: SpoIIE family protein phosphatase [Planctomycetia bacterium]|nr:SpoIIE family protein phosphatase [Planctomycetia bacterium]